MKNPIMKMLDWFVREYHSEDYIHVTEIKDEIKRHVDAATTRVNEIRDREMAERLQSEQTKYQIKEAGYIAEIENMEKFIDDTKKLRTDVESLYFKVMQKAKQLVIITAENKYEREQIVNDLSASMGRLDRLVREAENINLEIESGKNIDESLLRIK